MIRADGQLISHAGLAPSICPPYVFASPNFTPWYVATSQWFKETFSASPPAAVLAVMAVGIEPRPPTYKPCLLTTTLPCCVKGCKKTKGLYNDPNVKQGMLIVNHPLYLLCLNFTKMDHSSDGKENILVMMDAFSNLPWQW